MSAVVVSTQRAIGDPPRPGLRKLVVGTAIGVPASGVVLAVVLAFLWGPPPAWCVALFLLGWLWTGLGTTVGYHRMLSHRSFEAPFAVRAFWLAASAIGGQGTPLIWCAIHRLHHAHTDDEADPHSPVVASRRGLLRGLLDAHCGWLFTLQWDSGQLERLVPDLMKDPAVQYFERTQNWWPLAGLVFPTLVGYCVTWSVQGAVLGLVWGGLVRLFVTQHVSWGVNSFCHVFGSKMFKTNDESRNNALFGILALGEGWHNNHHAFPASARHGFGPWQFDLSWWTIRTMQLLGLATNVHLPSPEALARWRLTRP